ncbi:hypothetical protein Rctr197k_069 [Virus Rctr197k]|nr:hypothetical protein Rctr197k_069 [Virus Rctr197k]
MTKQQTTTTINWLNPPQAEEDPLLRDLETQMAGTQIRDTTTVCGHVYELETLWPHEESWADGYVAGQNFYQTGRNRRLPYIAAALRSIDGKSMSVLFKLPAETPQEMRDQFAKNPELLASWRREQVFMRLGGARPMLPPAVLSELWVFYQELEERRRAALEKIGPLSTRGDDGVSSPTSSQEKAS